MDYDYSRRVAESIALRLQAVGSGALTLSEMLGLRAQLSAADAARGASPADQIGVWCKQVQDGRTCYVRKQDAAGGWRGARERWADVEVIPEKSGRRRLLLLGESVARGYFYDPLHTPASVLESLLARHLPEGAEVIDLAANDLGSEELLELLRKTPLLQPDALVIFAGNNWSPAALLTTAADGEARQIAAAALRRGGVLELRRMLEARLQQLVVERLRMLPRLAAALRVPVVVVIPEFNLADWRGHAGSNAPWLPDDGNRRWWQRQLEARQAQQEQSQVRALEHAEAMLKLDGGVTHNALEIMAAALAAGRRHAEARAALELARDGRIWDPANLSPRCYSSIQDALRSVQSAQIRIVDLPAVFSQLSAGGLPNRTMFMDYCHLTAEFIAVTMACVARALVPDANWPSLEEIRTDRSLLPQPEVESAAHLLAAIHNAHWGQSSDTIRHHLSIAAESPSTLEAMRAVFDAQGRRVPAWMTGGAAALGAESNQLLSRYFTAYSRGRCFDEQLLDQMAKIFDRGAEGQATELLAARRKSEWSVQSHSGPVDLLADAWTHLADQAQPRHAQARSERTSERARGWYRAYAPTSRFPLVSARQGETGIYVEITCRQPPFFAAEGACRLRLNGEGVSTFALGASWSTHRIDLPAALIRAGVNELEFVWPHGSWRSAAAIEEAAAELEAGRLAELSPAFADVWGLRLAQRA